jgi:hypothetical protein
VDDAANPGDDAVVFEGRTEAGLLRVFTRVAHGEHLHAPSHPTHFTRRRPVAALGASARRARGTTARKVIWS